MLKLFPTPSSVCTCFWPTSIDPALDRVRADMERPSECVLGVTVSCPFSRCTPGRIESTRLNYRTVTPVDLLLSSCLACWALGTASALALLDHCNSGRL